MKQLTAAQTRVLEAIKAYITANGVPPARSDICKACGFTSQAGAEAHLKALQKKGAIALIPGISRGIRLVHSQ